MMIIEEVFTWLNCCANVDYFAKSWPNFQQPKMANLKQEVSHVTGKHNNGGGKKPKINLVYFLSNELCLEIELTDNPTFSAD